MNLVNRKKQHLEILKRRIEKHKREESAVRHQISILRRRKKLKKLICAGRIFEEAGILENYNREDVLAVLKMLHKE